MDAAAKPTGTYLRRPPQPDPPRHPTECPLLLWLSPLPWHRRVQGAALQKNTLSAQKASMAAARRQRCPAAAGRR
ncbi:hypothetical protein B9Y66_17205 [Stenotrophomonas maltophilia]|nr:hypothetical protein B9Y66_17205 [Stenotrophomonas maltophilia]